MIGAVRLRHVADINPPTSEFDLVPDDAEITFLPLEAVWPGSQLDATRVRPKSTVLAGYTRFRENDILIPKITPTFEADRSTIARGLMHGVAAGTTELHIVRPPANVDGRYLKYLFSSRPFLLGGEAEMIGVAGQKRVPDAWLRDLPVLVTDQDNQRVIADFLDVETAHIDTLIAKKIALVGLLTARLQASVEEFALGKGGGKRVPLKRVASVERGRFNYRPRNEPALYGGDFPFVQTGDIRSAVRYIDRVGSYLSSDGVAVSRSFPAGTTLMGIAANVGDVAISSFEVWCPDSVVGFTPDKMIDADYLYYMLKGLRSTINETSTENTQENTNIERLGLLTIPLLSLNDQRRIVSGLRSLEDRIGRLTARINRQIDLLKEHRQALITAAVTGEMEVLGVCR